MKKNTNKYQRKLPETKLPEKTIDTPKGNIQTYQPKMSELELSNTPTLVISKEVQNQILYYHSRTGKLEWSGFLLFEQEGDLNDITAMKLTAKYIHLLDIGTETFTNIENYDAFEVVDDIGDRALGYKMGIIHTHHSMSTFFSGVDTGCLHDNSENYPFLLSLIVNLEGKYCAKIAFIGKESGTQRKLTLNSRLDNLKLDLGTSTEKDVLITCNCNIQLEQDEHIVKRYDALLKRLEEEKKAKAAKWVPQHNPYGGNNYNGWKPKQTKYIQGEFDWLDRGSYKSQDNFGETKISEMSKDDLDDLLIKIVQADSLATGVSLFYELKRMNTILEEGVKDPEMGFWLDLVEDNFESIAERHFMRILTLDEMSELAVKIQTRLKDFWDVAIVEDLSELFEVWIIEEVNPVDKFIN